MARHRSYSIEFKRQVAQEYLGGESLNGLARRHDVSRNLIRVWIANCEPGAFDDEFQAADLLQQYEAKIAAWISLLKVECAIVGGQGQAASATARC
ncbi:MAG: transposase [Acidobacteria bacterium]|nr:transposase [Acidobacteriota bacterium]